MKKSELFVGVTFVTAVIAGTVIAVKFGLVKIQHLFDGLDPQTGIIIGVSAAVLLLGSALIAAAIRAAGSRQSDFWRNNERARIYQALLDTLASRADEVIGMPSPLARSLFLIGSAPVVKEYRTLVQMLSGRTSDEEPMRKQINLLMLAMRRDVGESTFGLENEDWAGWLHGRATHAPVEVAEAHLQTATPSVGAAAPAHRL